MHAGADHAGNSIHTLAVHAGERAAKPIFTPVATPIYHASSYVYDEMETLDATFAGTFDGPMYTRYGNPTVSALEAAVAALEGGEAALAYSSGMAAIHGALLAAGARAGTTVVAAHDVYGATYALLTRLLASQGVTTRFVDASRPRRCRGSPCGCPVLGRPPRRADRRDDLQPAAEGGRPARAGRAGARGRRGADRGQHLRIPLPVPAVGAWAPIMSSTAPPSTWAATATCWAAWSSPSQERRRELNEINKLVGANLGPQEAWLVLRGIKTLPLRVQRQCENAAQVAAWLAAHPQVSHVNYPGLASHPQHRPRRRGMLERGAFGAMISFDIRDGDRARVFRFMEALRLVLPATTLGDVYSLALYPAHSSHRALDPELRRRIGIGDGLVRLSVGIEDPADIMADLAQALDAQAVEAR